MHSSQLTSVQFQLIRTSAAGAVLHFGEPDKPLQLVLFHDIHIHTHANFLTAVSGLVLLCHWFPCGLQEKLWSLLV